MRLATIAVTVPAAALCLACGGGGDGAGRNDPANHRPRGDLADAQKPNDAARVDPGKRAADEHEARKKRAEKVTPDELLSAYKTNGVAADAYYKGKWIRVTGRVDAISKNLIGTIFVTFRSGKEFGLPQVQCMFSDKHMSKISRLVPGEALTIYGKCTGEFVNVIVRECEIVDDSAPTARPLAAEEPKAVQSPPATVAPTPPTKPAKPSLPTSTIPASPERPVTLATTVDALSAHSTAKSKGDKDAIDSLVSRSLIVVMTEPFDAAVENAVGRFTYLQVDGRKLVVLAEDLRSK